VQASEGLGVTTYQSTTLVTLGGCAPQYRTQQYTIPATAINDVGQAGSICYGGANGTITANMDILVPSGGCVLVMSEAHAVTACMCMHAGLKGWLTACRAEAGAGSWYTGLRPTLLSCLLGLPSCSPSLPSTPASPPVCPTSARRLVCMRSQRRNALTHHVAGHCWGLPHGCPASTGEGLRLGGLEAAEHVHCATHNSLTRASLVQQGGLELMA